MSGDRCADCGRLVGVGPDRTIDDGFCWSEVTRYDHDKLDCSRVVVARLRAEVEALRVERDAARACAREHINEVEVRLRDQRNEARTALSAAQKRIEGLEAALRMALEDEGGGCMDAEGCGCWESVAHAALRSAPPGAPASGIPAPAQQSESREAALERELRWCEWMPDERGDLRCPKCFGHALHNQPCSLRAALALKGGNP